MVNTSALPNEFEIGTSAMPEKSKHSLSTLLEEFEMYPFTLSEYSAERLKENTRVFPEYGIIVPAKMKKARAKGYKRGTTSSRVPKKKRALLKAHFETYNEKWLKFEEFLDQVRLDPVLDWEEPVKTALELKRFEQPQPLDTLDLEVVVIPTLPEAHPLESLHSNLLEAPAALLLLLELLVDNMAVLDIVQDLVAKDNNEDTIEEPIQYI
ncbi:hypothetical protein Pfo_001847 [Paulownia fortunei]|nr:hypothetical protein Pfo_001847 [Paulownia fortunei]